MAITVSSPTLWSARLNEKLIKPSVFMAALTNRNYESEVNMKPGSIVKILSLGSITIADYSKNTDMTTQVLTDSAATLTINQQKYFSFAVDDIDKVQSVMTLIEEGSTKAAEGFADVRDQYIASLHSGIASGNAHGDSTTPITIGFGSGETTPYTAITQLNLLLDKANVPTTDRRIVIPPWMLQMLKIELGGTRSGLSDSITENGMVGKVDGMQIFVSNNVVNTTATKYKVMAGIPMITYADQIGMVETMRSPSQFTTIVRGLYVYGAVLQNTSALALGTYNIGALA